MTLVAIPDPGPPRLTLAQLRDLPASLTAEPVAQLYGISPWSLYESVKNGNCPVMPFKIGRSLRWPTAAVLRSLGIDPADVLAGERP